MKGLLVFLLCILVIIILAGCDPVVTYDYIVKNNSNNTITVFLTSMPYSKDTNFLLQPSSDGKMVFGSLKYRNNPKDIEPDSLISLYQWITIFKNDSISAGQDFKRRERWEYNTPEKHGATYTLTITDSDF